MAFAAGRARAFLPAPPTVDVVLALSPLRQQLAGIVGDYVDGVTPESLNMSIGLRSGAAELVNLRIKQGVRVKAPRCPRRLVWLGFSPVPCLPTQALDKLELPFIVRVGVIEKISLKTPSYTSLLRRTGEPVVVRICGVYLLVDKSVQTPEEVRGSYFLCLPRVRVCVFVL